MSGLRSFQQAELEVIKLVERRTARDVGVRRTGSPRPLAEEMSYRQGVIDDAWRDVDEAKTRGLA